MNLRVMLNASCKVTQGGMVPSCPAGWLQLTGQTQWGRARPWASLQGLRLGTSPVCVLASPFGHFFWAGFPTWGIRPAVEAR